MHLFQQSVQKTGPVRSQLAAQQPLRARDVGHIHEAIVALLKRDSLVDQLASQPFAAVHTHEDGERQPGLQPHRDLTQFRMPKIKVLMQTLPRLGTDLDASPLTVTTQKKGPAGLDGGQDAHEPLGDAVRLGDVRGNVFLGKPAVCDKANRSPERCGQLGCGLFDLFGQALRPRV